VGSLLVDVGNTRLKWRFQQEGVVRCAGALPVHHLSLSLLREALPGNVARLFWSNVSSDDNGAIVRAWALEQQIPCKQISTQNNWQGLINGYEQAAQLGVDRWLAMIGARQRTPKAFCVVDCGSAITFDYVRIDGRHEGGYIIPGALLMSQSLVRDTANINISDEGVHCLSIKAQPGADTSAAVFAGCDQMVYHGVRGLISEAKLRGYEIILCGGDGIAIADKLNVTYVEGLVLDGLAQVAGLHKH